MVVSFFVCMCAALFISKIHKQSSVCLSRVQSAKSSYFADVFKSVCLVSTVLNPLPQLKNINTQIIAHSSPTITDTAFFTCLFLFVFSCLKHRGIYNFEFPQTPLVS